MSTPVTRNDTGRQGMGFISGLCLLAGFLLMPGSGMAAPVVEIESDHFRTDLSPYIDILEDSQHQLTIDEVRSDHYARQFSPAPLTDLYFGYTRSVYWLRFSIENKLDHDSAMVLEVTPADIDYVDFYGVDYRSNTVLFRKQSGSSVDVDLRDYSHPLYFFDLKVPARSNQVYFVRLQSNKTINAHLRIATPREHFYHTELRDWWQGFVFSALMVLGILHIGLAFTFNYKGFAYCGLTLLSIMFVQGSWNGYFLQYLHTNAALLDRQVALSVYAAATFGLLFTRSYLNLHERSRFGHRLLTVLIVISLMGIPCAWLFEPRINAMILGVVAVPTTFIVFGLAIYSFLEGYEPARYFLLVRTITIILSLMAVFSDQGLLVEDFVVVWGLAAGYVLEGIVFAFVMLRLQLQKQAGQRAVTAVPPAVVLQSQVPVSAFCHELRTPISGVMGMTELLMDTSLTDQQRIQVETIHHSGKTLLDVVNKMSDLALLEKGDVVINDSVFEIISLVESCVESARNMSERRNIELIYRVDESLAGLVKGDEDKIRQVLNNLVQYALRQLESGEILLSVSAVTNERVLFEVMSGKNTSLPELPGLRESARKLTSADNLNLTIARQFVSLMGSKLEMQDRADGGMKAAFQLTLRRQRRELLPDDENRWLRGRRLLVVDDNETCCKIVQQQASQWGMEVATASGGKEALAILRLQANLNMAFDLMLVDYDMPGMNGLELIARIEQEKAMLKAQNMLILILTGVSKMPGQLAGRPGIHRVLYKPLSGKSLRLALIEALQQAVGKST